MRTFVRALDEAGVDPEGRRWLFVPYDQLSDRIGPLAREAPREIGIVVVESPWKAARRPYHRQKLALVLANLRQFALEQARRGVAVRHVVSSGGYADALRPLARELGPLRCMRPAERELRAELGPLVAEGAVEILAHEGWLTSREQFERSQPKGPPYRMDAFYRRVRRDTGLLMADGKPAGGKFSFDAENREPWRGHPPAPALPSFPPNAIRDEVVELVETRFARHPGRLDPAALPTTREDAEIAWRWAQEYCLPWFGPFEDAMSAASRNLFHTRIAPLLHLHRLLARRVVEEAAALDAPLASREGFVRQILGWREFVRHVHEATDGFRAGPRAGVPRDVPGDGGHARWKGEVWTRRTRRRDPDGGAAPSHLGADGPLPPAYWGRESGLRCLDLVVRSVWEEGISHHITRLMVLANLATLLDVSPRELTDWFWAAYIDAFDWVVEPNVLGMGTFAVGDLMTTKPYVSGAGYIARMSDYCDACAFDPKRTCPITRLYWAFLGRHRRRLEGNPRLTLALASVAKRAPRERREDVRTFEGVRAALERGERLSPPDEPVRTKRR